MSKPKISLLENALARGDSALHPVTVNVTEVPNVPAAATVPPPVKLDTPWYQEVLERYPCDAEVRQWLVGQIKSVVEWNGGDGHIPVPCGLILALLQDLR